MSRIKFKLNRKGVRELMKSQEMEAILAKKASDIQNRCGTGYESKSYVGKTRSGAIVRAESRQAKRDNLKNNTLLKAMR